MNKKHELVLFVFIAIGTMMFLFIYDNVYKSNVSFTDIKIRAPLSNTEKTDILKSFAMLKGNCSSLFTDYKQDIERISASIQNMEEFYTHNIDKVCNLDYRCSKYGWKKEVYFQIKIVKNPVNIPPKFSTWGHTLHYIVSNDINSGIIAQKEQSQAVCGWSTDGKGSDVFISSKSYNMTDSNVRFLSR